jgi:hypothetical protein
MKASCAACGEEMDLRWIVGNKAPNLEDLLCDCCLERFNRHVEEEVNNLEESEEEDAI